MDLSKPLASRVSTEYAQWPKCWQCSRALGRPYPVERYKILGREPSRVSDGVYDLVLDVACTHGEARRIQLERESKLVTMLRGLAGGLVGGTYPASSEQRVRVEIPRSWTGFDDEAHAHIQSASAAAAIQYVYAFAPGAKGTHGVLFIRPGGQQTKVT